MVQTFSVQLLFKGTQVMVEQVITDTTGNQLLAMAKASLNVSNDTSIKLLYKGKRIVDNYVPVFSIPPKTTPKVMVLATQQEILTELNSKRSDPTIRGFDNERKTIIDQKQSSCWGTAGQDKVYKFGRFEACTWQSFGHRPTESTPHAFRAMELLETLATDPGVVAIMQERELFVNTLGEMDPIDDRLMQKTQTHGGCLLGYNTNSGLRIDIKLRTDDLKAFRPYPQLVSTLIHELSHNWVGEHNLLFWTNHGQMRVEYFHRHAFLTATGYVVNGKTTAQIAQVPYMTMEEVFERVMTELQQEMVQHGLHPRMIEAPIRQRCQELKAVKAKGLTVGGTSASGTTATARELALAAAERRARQQDNKDEKSDC